MNSLPPEEDQHASLPQTPSEEKPEGTPKTHPLQKKLFIIGGIILVLLVVIPILVISFIGIVKKPTTEKTTVTPTPKTNTNAAQPTGKAQQTQTLIYGTWTSQSSVIRAVDIASSKITTLATLPLTIKKVSVLSAKTLLYIDQTDKTDHGERISIYNIASKQITTNIPAATGYGIDDYVLSPKKQYLAIWEVSFDPKTNILQGGKSRVYIVDLTRPSVSNLLYDESVTETVPIHQPVAVLDDGTVFTDKFLPNDTNGGTGWAYGMSTVDFDGTNKQDIDTMQAGTYSSQPTLSPEGKYLLFAGYDGANGDGNIVKNGYRQALLTPDTVDLLNAKSLQRFQLPNLSNTNRYTSVQWDSITGNPIITLVAKDTTQSGLFSYDLATQTLTRLPILANDTTNYGYISQLPDEATLAGIQSNNDANLGNLGDHYAYAFTQLLILKAKTATKYLSTEDPFMQYITILPGNYFKAVLGDQTSATTSQTASPVPTTQDTKDNPQLYTFFLKTTLASFRLQGKSDPVTATASLCTNLKKARCSALGLSTDSPDFAVCEHVQTENDLTTNACY